VVKVALTSIYFIIYNITKPKVSNTKAIKDIN
jgi:hypothetical protein